MKQPDFEWNSGKNKHNFDKHGISFESAQYAFQDPNRVIAYDRKHSTKKEKRYFCYGKVNERVVTVRFTKRNNKIRIFGAGFWREGKERYYAKRKIY